MTQSLKQILCVDDDQAILDVARMSLEMVGGFQVSSYTSGTEAIEFAPATKPDMILLDVMMPGMDGLTTYAQLKKIPELQNTPILFVMARVQPKEVANYMALGAIGVIVKPFDPMKTPSDVKIFWNEFQSHMAPSELLAQPPSSKLFCSSRNMARPNCSAL
jgi:two-component system, OmpR family, response regulator